MPRMKRKFCKKTSFLFSSVSVHFLLRLISNLMMYRTIHIHNVALLKSTLPYYWLPALIVDTLVVSWIPSSTRPAAIASLLMANNMLRASLRSSIWTIAVQSGAWTSINVTARCCERCINLDGDSSTQKQGHQSAANNIKFLTCARGSFWLSRDSRAWRNTIFTMVGGLNAHDVYQ